MLFLSSLQFKKHYRYRVIGDENAIIDRYSFWNLSRDNRSNKKFHSDDDFIVHRGDINNPVRE
jgi:hypothetical protein